MLLKLFKGLSQRTLNIIVRIIGVMLIVGIASLVMCSIFLVTGKLVKLSFMTSLGGVCFVIFLIDAVVLITIGVILALCLFIDAVKRDGLIKLFKSHVTTFSLIFISVMVFYYIRHRNLEWIKSLWPALLVVFSLFLEAEVGILMKEFKKVKLLVASLEQGGSE